MPNEPRDAYEKNREKIHEIFTKADRAPMDISRVDQNAEANQIFLSENTVEEAKKEAETIDKILRGRTRKKRRRSAIIIPRAPRCSNTWTKPGLRSGIWDSRPSPA